MTNTTPLKLFQNLIWPAAAGNVLWSFFQVAIGPRADGLFVPSLFILAIVGFYLAWVWWRIDGLDRENIRRGYLVFDALLAITIVIFSLLTVQMNNAPRPRPDEVIYLKYALTAVLGVGVLGHLIGSWVKKGDELKWPKRLIPLAIDALGLAILWLTWPPLRWDAGADMWKLVIAIGTVVALLVIYRSRMVSTTLGKLRTSLRQGAAEEEPAKNGATQAAKEEAARKATASSPATPAPAPPQSKPE